MDKQHDLYADYEVVIEIELQMSGWNRTVPSALVCMRHPGVLPVLKSQIVTKKQT